MMPQVAMLGQVRRLRRSPKLASFPNMFEPGPSDVACQSCRDSTCFLCTRACAYFRGFPCFKQKYFCEQIHYHTAIASLCANPISCLWSDLCAYRPHQLVRAPHQQGFSFYHCPLVLRACQTPPCHAPPNSPPVAYTPVRAPTRTGHAPPIRGHIVAPVSLCASAQAHPARLPAARALTRGRCPRLPPPPCTPRIVHQPPTSPHAQQRRCGSKGVDRASVRRCARVCCECQRWREKCWQQCSKTCRTWA